MKRYYYVYLLFFTFITLFIINLFSDISNIERLEERLKAVSGKQRVDVLNELAEAYSSQLPEKSIEYGQTALQLSQKFNYAKGEAESWLSIGVGYNASGDCDEAFEYLKKSLKVFEEIGDKKGIADSLHNIGNSYYYLSNYDKALEYYLKSLKIKEEIGDIRGIADSLNNIGLIYMNLNNYDNALKYYLKSLKIREEIGNKKGIADSLNNIGLSYYYLSNYDKALEYYLKSLEIREEIGNKKGIADSLNNIVLVYMNLSNYDKALEYYLKSLKISEEIGNKKGIAASLNNIGNIYSDLCNYNKSLEYYIKSLKIKEEIGDKKGIAVSLNNIGNIYSDLGNYDKALEYHLKSLKIREEIGDKIGIAISLINIGQVHQNLKNYDRALHYLEKGLKTAKEIDAKNLITSCYEFFSDLYIAKSNYKKALEYYKLYVEVKNVIFSKESNDKIAEMQVKYETEKKEKEIDILQKDNKIQNLEITRQRNYLYSLAGISGLILVLFLLAFHHYRARKRANRMLSEKNLTINEQNDQLTRTLDELRETQKILVDTAHRAGMAEMANGTLHNIGNVLNSVKVSSQVLKEKSEESEMNDLRQVIRLIKKHADEPINFLTLDAKGKMIPAYLAKAGKALEKEYNAFMEELSHLNNGINHIEEILSVQQNYAGVSGITESIALSKVLDDVLRMYRDTFRRYNIKLVKQYKETSPVLVEKIKLMQVFINILKNAKESLEQKSDGDKVMTIDILENEEKKRQMVEISDNGVGIAKENIDRIFQYGFTTKKDSKGFGLHISALAMDELKGGLSAFSEGEDLGATFTVVVPKREDIGDR